MDTSYDLIVVGTGFASSFFLMEYLKHAKESERILVLEKGDNLPYSWKIQNKSNSNYHHAQSYDNLTPEKPWVQNIAFGGGSCWIGNTPRMHPSDFKTQSLHGVGDDWPFDYEQFEPYLVEVENYMGIAGNGSQVYPRSKPYPMVGHKLNAFDLLLKEKFGEEYLAMPSARASDASMMRPPCCNNGVCSVCPIGAKFQVDLYMRKIYEDARVELKTGSSVSSLLIDNDVVRGVNSIEAEKDITYFSDLVAVGAHAINTPAILLRSGLNDYALGRYINEQSSVDVKVNLDGVENYDGGQRVTGLGSMFANESNRSEVAAALVENYNIPWLRAEFGKWRHVGLLKFVFEDIPSADNRVTVTSDGKTQVDYKTGFTQYAKNGFASLPDRVERLLGGLPIEDYHIEDKLGAPNLGGSAHIQGTTRMGLDPKNSVVDAGLIHHKVRNLAVLGSGAFPTCPAANPTLILSALSVKSARELMS